MDCRLWNIAEPSSGEPSQCCTKTGIDAAEQQASIFLFQEKAVCSCCSKMFQVEDQRVVNIAKEDPFFQPFLRREFPGLDIFHLDLETKMIDGNHSVPGQNFPFAVGITEQDVCDARVTFRQQINDEIYELRPSSLLIDQGETTKF